MDHLNDLFGIKPMFSDAAIIAAQREYARNPTTLFERAGKGSPFYMHNLLINMSQITEGPKIHQLDSLMATIYSFLSIRGPSKRDTAETYKTSMVVLGCLEALYRIGEYYDLLGEDAKRLFTSAIPFVVRILSIGCDDFFRPIPNAVDHSTKLKRLSAKMFISYLSNASYGPVVDDILKVSLKMWLLDRTTPSDLPYTVACMNLSGSMCCNMGSVRRVRRILDKMPDLDHVAHLALKRLQASKQQVPVDFPVVFQHTNAVFLFSTHPRLAQILVEKNAITTLCEVLKQANALRADKQLLSRRTCLLALNDLLPVAFSGFREALANDLLHNLLLVYLESAGQTCRDATVAVLTDTLEDVLPPLLRRRSNLKMMLDAAESRKDVAPVLKRNSLGGPWAAFERKLLSMAVAHHLFIFYRTSKLYQCENPNCRKLLPRKSSSRCAGCKEALYCDRGCQRQHWKIYGHRYECRSAIGLVEALGSRVRDRAFVVYLAANEVVRHRHVLRRMAEQKFPHVPLEHIGFKVDFSDAQASLDVYNIFGFDEDHIYSCMEHVQATRLALEADPRLSTMLISVQNGSRVCTFQCRTAVDELNEAIEPSLRVTSEQCPVVDASGNRLEALPDVIDGLTSNVRKSIEGKNKKGHWDQSVIEKEVRKSTDAVRKALLLQ